MFARTSLTRFEGSRSDSNTRLMVFQESSDSVRRSSSDAMCIRDFDSKFLMNDCSSIGASSDARVVITGATKLSTNRVILDKGFDVAVYTLFRRESLREMFPTTPFFAAYASHNRLWRVVFALFSCSNSAPRDSFLTLSLSPDAFASSKLMR